MKSCLEAAIEYATKYGWPVFPVSVETKHPLTPHGHLDAKTDLGAIRHWWTKWPNAAIAVPTGATSGFFVIDEDYDPDEGKNGYEAIRDWSREHGEFPDTVQSITGRGGYHLYFKHPGFHVKTQVDVIYGVDVRGDGGYIILPPSRHKNGSYYEWEYGLEDIPMAEANEAVLEFISLKDKEETESKSFQLPTVIPSGARNDTLFRLACSLQAKGVPDAGIMAAVKIANDEQCQEPLPQDELENLVSSALKHQKGELKIISKGLPEWHEPKLAYKLDKDGNVTDSPIQSIANCEEAIAFDKDLFGRIRYNEIAYAPYVYGNLPWKTHKGWREWTNTDDSNLRAYIEKNYGMKSMEKIMDALTNVCTRYPVNPIRDLLEACHEKWDGNKHVENLLPAMLGAEKSDYTTAVMKLFMLGAVSRIYKPGCKFDYMMVLVSGQGTGKSTFLRLLTLNDEWFHDNFNTLDGDKAFEKLRGIWIAELAELQATKRSKDVETIKSFITSRVDTYRAPYGRRTEQHPRMCVLAGTSNPVDFLTDRTGNRRFLPITCGITPATFDIFADETITKAEIAQAWGEIMDEFKRSGEKPRLVLPKRLQDKAIEIQTAYLEEDPDIGIIQEWLDQNTDVERVCAVMLWREALKHEFEKFEKRDVNRIHEIMKNNVADDWIYVGKKRCGEYGTQRCYDRKKGFIDVENAEIPFD